MPTIASRIGSEQSRGRSPHDIVARFPQHRFEKADVERGAEGEAYAQAMADLAREYVVEHLAQGEAAGAGDAHGELVVVGGAPPGQAWQFELLRVGGMP